MKERIESAPARRRRRTREGDRSNLRKRMDRQKDVIVILPMIKIVVFSFVPLVGIIMAFQNYIPSKLFLSPWVGFDNFAYIFKSGIVWQLVRNAIIFNFLFVTTGTVMGVLLGLFLFQLTNKFVIKLFQAIYFFPVFVAWPLVGLFISTLLGANEGILTNLIFELTGNKIMFYNEPKYWRTILTITNIWKGCGFSAITYYCILLGMDHEIYEAADIDGAGVFRKMWTVSLANLKYMIFIGLITACGGILRVDSSMMWFTVGMNTVLLPTTDVFETFQLRALSNGAKLGQPVALGLFQGVVGLGLSLIVNRAIKLVDRDASLF